jgi:hypothetical protein
MSREARWIADTGFLLSFGAISNGLEHLSRIFGGAIGSPPAVKTELLRIAADSKHSADTKDAASKYLGKKSGFLIEAPLLHQDVPERDTVLEHLAKGTLPTAPGESAVWAEEDPKVVGHPEVTLGQDAGEAESIAICVRTRLPLLLNEQPATKYAECRDLNVEPAAVALRRLGPAVTPKQMYGLYRQMTKVNDGGVAAVTGYLWFTQPPMPNP